MDLSTAKSIGRSRAARLAGAAALVLATCSIGLRSPTDALGPVVAITPNEINMGAAGDPGALNPSLSGRGETAGVSLYNFGSDGWAQFDVAGPEPAFGGRGITVSGDGCSALWVEPAPIIILLRQTPPRVILSRRCPGFEDRPVMNLPDFYDARAQSALSFTGKFGVIVTPTVAGVPGPGRVIRIDTDTGAALNMPVGGDPAPFLGTDISDDGNVVVATFYYSYQDPTSEFPTFTTGVFVWDVPSGKVSTVGPINPTGGGSAGFPSISGNGQFVSFTSSVALTGTETGFGPWVYVTDRANGATRLISRANASGFNTSLSRDGSQVAYGTAASCTSGDYNYNDMSGMPGLPGFQGVTCGNPRIDVTFGPGPLTTAPLTTETVSVAPNGSVATGFHAQPALSGNGRWVAWITNNARGLGVVVAGQNAVMRRRDPGLVIDPIDFGTIAASTTSTIATTVRNTGRTSVSLDSITATPGQFTIQGGGTCVGGSLLPPGATCTVNVRYAAPPSTSTTTGSINIAEAAGYDAISAAGRLTGSSSFNPPPTTTTIASTTTTTVVGQVPPGRTTTTTTTTTTTPPGHVSLTADPNPVDFGQVAVGLGSPIQTVTITNIGDGSGQVLTELGGPNPEDFFVVDNGCNELVIAPGQACTMQIMMIPLAGGHREASLILTAGGVSGDIAMFGEGHFAPLLLATPTAITSDGTTTVIGQGFPPNQTFDVHVDPTSVVLTVSTDALGQFQFPLSAVPNNLMLGSYVLRVDPLPDVFDLVQGQLVVVLGTFEPQGPGGPIFGDSIIVTRGG